MINGFFYSLVSLFAFSSPYPLIMDCDIHRKFIRISCKILLTNNKFHVYPIICMSAAIFGSSIFIIAFDRSILFVGYDNQLYWCQIYIYFFFEFRMNVIVENKLMKKSNFLFVFFFFFCCCHKPYSFQQRSTAKTA